VVSGRAPGEGRRRLRKERERAQKERARADHICIRPRRVAGPGRPPGRAKKAKQLWKDVRAYDASDLEQWLEQSLPAQAWFAYERHIPAQHCSPAREVLGGLGERFATTLTGTLFSSAIEATKRTMLSRPVQTLRGPDPDRGRPNRGGDCLPCPTARRAWRLGGFRDRRPERDDLSLNTCSGTRESVFALAAKSFYGLDKSAVTADLQALLAADWSIGKSIMDIRDTAIGRSA
jgi:hypothetical protein